MEFRIEKLDHVQVAAPKECEEEARRSRLSGLPAQISSFRLASARLDFVPGEGARPRWVGLR